MINQDKRKYFPNHNFFENIDSEEKAWILGWISADGWITSITDNKLTSTLSLAVKDSDSEVLYKIGSFIYPNFDKNHVKYRSQINHTSMAYLTISSSKITNDLLKLNIVPQKSLILKPPILNKNIIKFWVRGVFEGDGCISDQNQIVIVGTKEITSFIENEFNLISGINGKISLKSKSQKNTYSLTYSKIENSIQFLNWIYDGCNTTCTLKRKYEKYLNFKEKLEKQKDDFNKYLLKIQYQIDSGEDFIINSKKIWNTEFQALIFEEIKNNKTHYEITKKFNLGEKDIRKFAKHCHNL